MGVKTVISALGILALGLSGCSAAGDTSAPSSVSSLQPTAQENATPQLLRPEVLSRADFNPSYFTQGLDKDSDGSLLVGTGGYGTSGLYRLDSSGKVIQSATLPDAEFGEGITLAGDDLWQLTWKEHRAYRRDATTFEVKDTYPLDEEGWGICFDGAHLWTSDGSSTLTQRNPETFEAESTLLVRSAGHPVEMLNELECVDGAIYANVFLSTNIVKISPTNGQVVALIDASNLPNNAIPDPNNVLNGIAHIPGSDRFLMTGKRWPDLYEVRLAPR